MATIIDLDAARRRRHRGVTRYLFDLASPWTYLTAAAVAETVHGVEWVPVLGLPSQRRAVDDAVEEHALELGIRFAWPEGGAPDGRQAARLAALAVEQGRGAAFALAASRLAYGWGRDLDSLDVLAEAAGASGVRLSDALEAVFDPRLDDELERAAAHVDVVPALEAGGAPLTGMHLSTNLMLAHPAARRARR
jgi:2-hydroxychromene-2-carboxylate isomerase